MDANRPRKTLEAPRRHTGTALEAPKKGIGFGALHDHAPALKDADFDTSKYASVDTATPDYSRAEYIPPSNNERPAWQPASLGDAAVNTTASASATNTTSRNTTRPSSHTTARSALEAARRNADNRTSTRTSSTASDPFAKTPGYDSMGRPVRTDTPSQPYASDPLRDHITRTEFDAEKLPEVGRNALGGCAIFAALIGSAVMGAAFWTLLFIGLAVAASRVDTTSMNPPKAQKAFQAMFGSINPMFGNADGLRKLLFGLAAASMAISVAMTSFI